MYYLCTTFLCFYAFAFISFGSALENKKPPQPRINTMVTAIYQMNWKKLLFRAVLRKGDAHYNDIS